MNFISLREQLKTWTLQSDQKLYKVVKELSDNILEAERTLANTIQQTKYSIVNSQVETGCSYNHYLRISQSKFTQNKIGAKEQTQEEQNIENVADNKNKIDIFKEAIEIGLKNMEIDDDKQEQDLLSISDTSLSQSIYEDSRLPAFFGSSQFNTKTFMNLFSQADLNESRIQKPQFSVHQIKIQPQNNPPLQKPPSLEQALQSNNGNPFSPSSNSSILPPPPEVPREQNYIPIERKVSEIPNNLAPPPPPPPPPINPPTLTKSSLISEQIIKKQSNEEIRQDEGIILKEEKTGRTLSMQEELSMRLKHGKDYNKQIEVTEQKQVQKNIPLNAILEERQSIQSNRSDNINKLIRQSTVPFQTTENKLNLKSDKVEEEEEQSSLFNATKSKMEKRNTNKFENTIMNRKTFNQDLIFKKKTNNLIDKPNRKPLFNEDEQEDVIVRKPKPEKNQIKQKKKPNKLLDSDSEEQDFGLFKKKENSNSIKSKLQPKSQDAEKKSEIKKQSNLVEQKQKKAQVEVQEKSKQIVDEKQIVNVEKIEKLENQNNEVKVENKKQQKKEVETQKTEKTSLRGPSLTTRRKKNKPKLNASKGLFQNDIQKQEQVSITKIVSEKTSDEPENENIESRSSVKSIKDRIVGMGGQGMPLILPGMKLTKPSQAKEQESIALSRLKEEEQKKQSQRKLEQIENIKIKKEEQKKLQQQLQKKRLEEKRRIQEQKLLNQRQQKFKKEALQKEKLKEKQETQKLQIKPLPKIPLKTQSSIKNNTTNQKKSNPLGGMPTIPKIQEKKTVPKISTVSKKGTLFETEDNILQVNKKKSTQNKTKLQRKGLFEDEEDQFDVIKEKNKPISLKPGLQKIKDQKVIKQKKKSLFDDDDDDSEIIIKKKVEKKQQSIVHEEKAFGVQKMGKKKGLFDDDEEDEFIFKSKVKEETSFKKKKTLFDQQPVEEQKKTVKEEQRKSKNFFNDSDSDKDSMFEVNFKKKRAATKKLKI